MQGQTIPNTDEDKPAWLFSLLHTLSEAASRAGHSPSRLILNSNLLLSSGLQIPFFFFGTGD